MGKTSSTVKDKWNKKHYTPVKVAVKPETAAAFKAACAAAGSSMASVLSDFMGKYTGAAQEKAHVPVSVKTLRDRRKAMLMIYSLITEMRDAEEKFMNRMPENLQGSSRYDDADERLGKLDDAIDIIGDIYT